MVAQYKRSLLLRASRYQRPVLNLIVASALITVVIISLCISFIYHTMVNEAGYFDAEVPVAQAWVLLVLMAMPLLFLGIIIRAYKVTNQLVGAFERLLRELDGIIATNEKRHVSAREGDELAGDVVKRINILIDKIP